MSANTRKKRKMDSSSNLPLPQLVSLPLLLPLPSRQASHRLLLLLPEVSSRFPSPLKSLLLFFFCVEEGYICFV